MIEQWNGHYLTAFALDEPLGDLQGNDFISCSDKMYAAGQAYIGAEFSRVDRACQR